MKVYLVLVDDKVSQQAFYTDKEAIEFIMSRSHPVINGEGWNFQGIDKDLKVTKYQITDVMIGGENGNETNSRATLRNRR